MNSKEIVFKISNGSEEDFLMLRKIHKSAMFQNVLEGIGEWNEDIQKTRLEQHFREDFKTLEFIILDNEIIGTINSRTKKYADGIFHFVEQFYLLPAYQGKGLGCYLLNLKINHQTIKTRLSVLKKDIKAQTFYLKNGFVQYQEDEYQKYMEK